MTWRLKRTRQCDKCPWRKDVNPFDIPNGYDPDKHRALANTIAGDDPLADLAAYLAGAGLNIFACHETHDAHCVGWLVNQLGPGNNIPLRLSMSGCANARKLRTVGEQHETFEDTLP